MANPQFVLRSLDVWAVYSIANNPPFAVAGTVGILSAINREQGSSVKASQVTLSAPNVAVGDAIFNTNIVLTAVPGAGFKGTYTFRYNRVGLDAAFAGQSLTISGTFADVYSALPSINTKFNIALEQKDVANTPISGAGGTITLTTSSTSTYYVPGSQVILNAAGSYPSLADSAPVTDLGGFDPS